MNICPKDCKNVVIISFVVGLVIVLYFIYRTTFNKEKIINTDPLNKVLFRIGPITVSWWPISHFILYAILGFFFPSCFIPLMILGILWEIFEFILGLFSPKRQAITQGIQYGDKWWSANLFDPLFNAAGFLFGMLIAKSL